MQARATLALDMCRVWALRWQVMRRPRGHFQAQGLTLQRAQGRSRMAVQHDDVSQHGWFNY